METEDGVIWVYGPGDDSVIAFTPFGIENLQEFIEMDRDPARVDLAVAYAGCLHRIGPDWQTDPEESPEEMAEAVRTLRAQLAQQMDFLEAGLTPPEA